jgi:hypothetical protein
MARVKKESGTTEAPKPSASLPRGDLLETSAQLVKELETADKEVAKEKARAIVFESANAAFEKPMDARFEKIVERTFAPKDWSLFQDKLDAWMELGDRRTEEAFIRKAHEEGPSIVREGYACYLQIRLARETWERENDVILGAMREQATEALQGEKDRGARNKTITEADIVAKCSTSFPDEWPRQESKRLKYKLTEDRAKHDVEDAILRCRHLDTMMSRLRT